MMKRGLLFALLLLVSLFEADAQISVAHHWNEAILQAIRQDFPRPTVHSRNLFHISVAMYDAWAAYDDEARPYLLGNTVAGYTCAFDGVTAPADVKAAREMALSYAVYRIAKQRYSASPNAALTLSQLNGLMDTLGYDIAYTDSDYHNGNPAALGNYIGEQILAMGLVDGSNEVGNYAFPGYQTVNPALVVASPGNPNMLDPNRWQRLTIQTGTDGNGNPIIGTQNFLTPGWGNTAPFSLTANDLSIYQRNNINFKVYHDPGAFPMLDTTDASNPESKEFKWNMQTVAYWTAMLDPNDGEMVDISPKSMGNLASFPSTFEEYQAYYNTFGGGDNSPGRNINPKTGQPYEEYLVPRGDYARVLAQFWADGPTSETPPGHWYTLLNDVTLHPEFVAKFNGKGEVLDQLEWDVKAYLMLGGALYDAGIAVWGIKSWHDGVRPLSALRYMAAKGQSTDPQLPSYHPAGVELEPGLIELIYEGDSLAGPNNENVGKIKFYSWLGFSAISNPQTQTAGAGWILADKWMPYQRKTFVTPPFAGYISGHSTFSRAAAEVLTYVTGDEYFPGGFFQYTINANSNQLVVEQGPSVTIPLQYATYRDAADQAGLSRIFGGIHPPMDDIPGRKIGKEVAEEAQAKAVSYFYRDMDQDGFYSFEDCNDSLNVVYPGAEEFCDGLDNNCNATTDEGLDLNNNGTPDCFDPCVSPAGFADIRVESASINPSDIYVGGVVTLQVTLKNAGDKRAAARSNVRWYLSLDEQLDVEEDFTFPSWVRQTPRVAANAEWSFSRGLWFPANSGFNGDAYIIFVADADQQLTEGCEDNNRYVVPVHINSCTSDIITESIYGPSCVRPGIETPVCVSIKNQGIGTAPSSFVKFYLSINNVYSPDDMYIGNATVPAVSAGNTMQACGNIIVPIGTPLYYDSYILAIADASNAACETDELNNTAFKVMKVRNNCGNNLLVVASNQGSHTAIDWVAQFESDVLDVEIEKSNVNEPENFFSIGSQGGFNASNQPVQQTAKDFEPFDGDNYYRLRITHTDGTVVYSEAEKVVFAPEDRFTILPNPADHYTYLNLQKWADLNTTIQIFDGFGVEVFRTTTTPATEGGLVLLDLSSFHSGLYQVRVTADNKRPQVMKLVIAQ